MSVGTFRSTVQTVERKLSNSHTWPQFDWQRRYIRQLQRYLTSRPPRIDKPRSCVNQQAQPAQRRLTLYPRYQVVRQTDRLVGSSQYKLARMKNERLIGAHIYRLHQLH